jgi:O-antigen ligase
MAGPAWRSAVVFLVMLATPFVFGPGLSRPFFTPKTWLFVAGAVGLLAWTALERRTVAAWGSMPAVIRVAIAAWAASFAWSGCVAPDVSPESLALGLAGPAWVVGLVASGIPARHILWAHIAAALAMSLVALAQAAGYDPLALTGQPPVLKGASERLRVYATLGNPNFVAAWLATVLPGSVATALSPRHYSRLQRTLAWGAVLATIGALAATGSRGGALGAGAGLVALAASGPRRVVLGMLLATALATTLVLTSSARPVQQTLEGRVYIWKVTAPHAFERPAAGFGPGAFELLYPGWEREARSREPDGRRFGGPQQHAHDDYLEALVERGLPGLLSTLLVILSVVLAAARQLARRDWHPELAGGMAGMVAIAAVATVDFPLARPAELAAVWSLVACVALACASPRTPLPPT